MKRFKFKKLPKTILPSKHTQNQLYNCQRPHGLIFSTYKSLITGKDTIKSDVMVDVDDFNAISVIDNFNKEIVGWMLYAKGAIYGQYDGYQTMYYVKPFYRGLGLGTKLFDIVAELGINDNKPVWVYPSNDNKWFFKKMKIKYPKLNLQNIYKIR